MKNFITKHKESFLILVGLSLISVVYLVSSMSKTPTTTTPSTSPSPFPTFVPYDLNQYQRVLFFDSQENFEISFLPKSNEYLISISGSPFAQHRTAAEQAFLQQLHLLPAQACQLKVSITTPRFANPKESGQVYRLSFCPPSTPLHE